MRCKNERSCDSVVESSPYTILYEERCGRMLVAARDIQDGVLVN